MVLIYVRWFPFLYLYQNGTIWLSCHLTRWLNIFLMLVCHVIFGTQYGRSSNILSLTAWVKICHKNRILIFHQPHSQFISSHRFLQNPKLFKKILMFLWFLMFRFCDPKKLCSFTEPKVWLIWIKIRKFHVKLCFQEFVPINAKESSR